MKTISISDARNHLPSIIDEVMSTHEQMVVLRHDTPTVTIIPFQGVKPGENRYPQRSRRPAHCRHGPSAWAQPGHVRRLDPGLSPRDHDLVNCSGLA
jgi:prevent-host-death family protein